jgi:ATP phosphoribosyltransferase regulatory subunit
MVDNDRWLLPEGIDEILPPEAERHERVRRRLLDQFSGWGYELIMPPLVEYLESLLTGTGNDLDLRTFKLTDQLNGRLMGVRADITPQAARIDANRLHREVPTRLCYLGTVLHTRPQVHGGSRAPMQVGAELYGHGGPEADIEVLTLMVETLRAAGLEAVHLDLGHVGIFRGLARAARLDSPTEQALFDALQRKAKPEIGALLRDGAVDGRYVPMLAALADLHGGDAVLDEAGRLLADAGREVADALANLRRVAAAAARLPGVTLHFDLAELRGYHYHTGVVFAAVVAGQGQAVAQGGRYDDIGHVFGRARAATGFSADLRGLLAMLADDTPPIRGIFAPCVEDPVLDREVATLRAAGRRVVRELPGQTGGALEMGCDQELVRCEAGWRLAALTREG